MFKSLLSFVVIVVASLYVFTEFIEKRPEWTVYQIVSAAHRQDINEFNTHVKVEDTLTNIFADAGVKSFSMSEGLKVLKYGIMKNLDLSFSEKEEKTLYLMQVIDDGVKLSSKWYANLGGVGLLIAEIVDHSDFQCTGTICKYNINNKDNENNTLMTLEQFGSHYKLTDMRFSESVYQQIVNKSKASSNKD